MARRIRHYGWLVSPYSAKTRAYLTYKQVDFDDVAPSAVALFGRIRRAVGAAVMPTVEMPDGTWLQDSSEIIDAFERLCREPPVVPATPRQRVAAYLFELHGDEWLPIPSMHYRWNDPENARFAVDEFAAYGLPGAPRFVARRVAAPIADKMRGYRPVLGIDEQTAPGIERYTETLIRLLDLHLAERPFLLGTRPCIGDFALFGQLWAHPFRDPGSRHLFDEAPHVRGWFDRLVDPSGEVGDFDADDAVAPTLDPLVALVCGDHFAYLRDLVDAIDAWCAAHPDAVRVPRSLGDTPFVIGGAAGTRRLITYSQWMLQRVLDARDASGEAGRRTVDEWLARAGVPGALDIEVGNRLVRRGFNTWLDR